MKSLSLVIALCAVLLALTATVAQTKSKTNESGYFGPVASARTETIGYSIDGGKPHPGERKLDSIEIFDRAGRLIEEKYFTDEGAILYQYKHRYDSGGRRVESSGTHSRFTYLSDRITYVYDSVGDLIAENGFDSAGKLVNKSEYAYDEKHRKTRWTSMSNYPPQNSKPHQWTYDYYDNNLVREERAFLDEGGGFRPTDSLGAPHRKFFMYNSQNKPAFCLLYNANGGFAGIESTTYDRRGNELEEVRYQPSGALKDKTKYSYTFDRFGNWVVQKTYEWDLETNKYQLSEISYQIIEYRK
jgi:hypothetical protein